MMNVALIQWMALGNDRRLNLQRALEATRQAAAEGADIVVFPEMWLIGYTPHGERDDLYPDLWRSPEVGPAGVPLTGLWDGLDVPRDAAEVTAMRELAREHQVAVLFTFLETWPGGPRNTAVLIDRRGEIVLTYAKTHLCVFDSPEYLLTPGDEFPVATLDTAQGEVKIGIMICYDREFPEVARLLMIHGAELILVPNACDMEANRLAQLRSRATENMVGVAMANYAGPEWGGSAAYHPIAFKNGRSQDTTIVVAGEDEQIVHACFDLEEIRDYRRRETWGNATRRPAIYGDLLKREVEPPFVRVNAAGQRWDAGDTPPRGENPDL